MLSRGLVGIFVFLIVASVFSGFVSAQAPTNERFSGENVKESLLDFRIVSLFDGLFQKVNFVFVFLFFRNYSFTFGMLFIVMMWIASLIIAFKYFGLIIDNEYLSLLASVAGVILLSWLQIFNGVLLGVNKLLEYVDGTLKRFVIWVLVVVALFVLYRIGRGVVGGLRGSKKEREKAKLKKKVEKGVEFRKNLREGAEL